MTVQGTKFHITRSRSNLEFSAIFRSTLGSSAVFSTKKSKPLRSREILKKLKLTQNYQSQKERQLVPFNINKSTLKDHRVITMN